MVKSLRGASVGEEVHRPQDRPPDRKLCQSDIMTTRQLCNFSMVYAPIAWSMPIEHDPGPLIQVNTLTIETTNGDEYNEIMIKRELEEYVTHVNTMYKRKDKKVCECSLARWH